MGEYKRFTKLKIRICSVTDESVEKLVDKQYNWWMVFALTMIPMVGLIGTSIYIYFYGIVWQEPAMTIVGWWIAGLGITFGYHRLFAHRSFKAHPAIQAVAMLCGTSALQNSI